VSQWVMGVATPRGRASGLTARQGMHELCIAGASVLGCDDQGTGMLWGFAGARGDPKAKLPWRLSHASLHALTVVVSIMEV
jgi:hypothetical protein